MKRLSSLGRRALAIAALAFGSFIFMPGQADAGHPAYGSFGYRPYGYGVGWRHAYPYSSRYHGGHYHWHDTSHYDWHDTSHFHRVGPFLILHRTGHWDFHPEGHWDYHGGHHHH